MTNQQQNRAVFLTVLCFLLLLVTLPGRATELPEQKAARMAWWNEARFGLFIHWGVYAVPAGEWNGKKNYGEWFIHSTKMPMSQYEQFVPQFNPVKFDAQAWVKMAKDAGQKYLVITSKHHDGFAMFHSGLSDWGIKSTPFQRDPLKELADECHKQGIKMCFYYSIMDWHNPDWPDRPEWNDRATGTPDMARYVEYMKGQLKELLTNYGPIGVLWFDGEWEKPWTHELGEDLYAYVRSLQPDIIVNNRVGKGRGASMAGMDTGKGVGDFGTPEQEIPAMGFGPGVYWESCMTMNRHWGYNKHDQKWKSTRALLENLVDCASKGGNYLLNVGPTSEGLIPEPSQERLKEMGAWLKVNGEAIYGTSASPFAGLTWGRCTQKSTESGHLLYFHVFQWPENGKLEVPGLESKIVRAHLLANGAKLKTSSTGGNVVFTLPKDAPDANVSVIAVEIKGPVMVAAAKPTAPAKH